MKTHNAASYQVLTCCHDTGPFNAHIINGVWAKSTPLKPNLPVGHNAYAVRNRLVSPDRLRYPLKRVDFQVNGARNPQTRGTTRFTRISWQEALDTIISELTRVKTQYGPSAILHSHISHQWLSCLHDGQLWSNRFFGLLGGCTNIVGNTSYTGWRPGGALVWGVGITATNNAADILHNTRLILHWASDVAVKRYSEYRQNQWLHRFKEAGIKQIVIDPYYSDTAALYGDDWIPILPGADEAFMAAIAYIWLSEGLYDPSFVTTHTVGFDRFKDYIQGTSDGVPKTPRWAASICDVREERIRDLAHEWASNPTYIICDYGGANRRDGAAEWIRMLVTMQALQGNIGRPGRGLGILQYTTRGRGQKGVSSILPPMVNRHQQSLRHASFPDAILTPPITWTTIEPKSGAIKAMRYPAEGCSKIHLIAFMSGSGMFLNQVPGTNDHVRALRSPEIEFVYTHAAWWHTAPKFSDIILPIRHTGERDDIVEWDNYTLYSHTITEPPGEPKNDLEIFLELARRLGFADKFAQQKTPAQWLHAIYDSLEIPLSFEAFKEQGYYTHPLSEDTPQVLGVFRDFYHDPDTNRLPTPSGKIEIYSQRVADFFGEAHPQAPTVPMYLPSPEHTDTTCRTRYPLRLLSPHPKLARHSQWRNLSWERDELSMRIKGYNPVRMNPLDAAARGIQTGDIVRLYNDRGSILCAADVTERLRPGVVHVWEGGWYTPYQSMDVGGNPNVLLSRRQPEAVCDGMVNSALVGVEPWRR